ncbi:MAG: winged helix-turn-helix domain-containing protein [Sulfolobaceae archaeon]
MDELFEAIAHEVRRKIIILLANGPKSFSELQKETGLDSPALSFHIKKLNGLITKNQQGNYELTQLGWSAYNIITQLTQPQTQVPKKQQSKKSLHDYINGILSNVAENVASLLDSISSRLSDDSITSYLLQTPLIEVFNGTLPLKKVMVISVDGGKVKILQGDNKAEVKCLDSSGFSIEENEIELRLSFEGCTATIYYPQLERLEIDIDGGMVNVEESISDVKVGIDGGYVTFKVRDIKNASAHIDGGVITGELEYLTEGKLELEVDGGYINLRIKSPEDVGLVVDRYVNGGSVKANNVIRTKNIIAKVDVDGGFVTLNKV